MSEVDVRNSQIIEHIPAIEWEPLDSFHLVAGLPMRPPWRAPVRDEWFAWHPVKTDDGWVWLQTVARIILRRTRYPGRRLTLYRRLCGAAGARS